jgi:hypothetical protein
MRNNLHLKRDLKKDSKIGSSGLHIQNICIALGHIDSNSKNIRHILYFVSEYAKNPGGEHC